LQPQQTSRKAARRGAEALALAAQAALATSVAYLFALLLAARRHRGAPAAYSSAEGAEPSPPRLVVLIPAHNEEAQIGSTLRSLLDCDYPAAAWRAIVIADNCDDGTAATAEAAGATVWERTDPRARGKGHALAWALERLLGEGGEFDAVVFIDADCACSQNFLSAVSRRLAAGARAIQVDNVVDNPTASDASALRFAGFSLANTIRSRGKARLGVSCGLTGTGMAFARELVEAEPWTTGLAEDGEYHMRLVLAGERVEFAPEAAVSSEMPTTHAGSHSQQARWEKGRLDAARHWTPRLLRSGITQRDAGQVHVGLECLVPPQSLIAAGSLASILVGALAGSRRLAALATATLLGQAAYVLLGLRLVRAPGRVYRALLTAPRLIASKVVLYAKLISGRGPQTWVRTGRREEGRAPEEDGATIAYLCSEYPAVSHTFVLREVEALRARGASIETFSIRRTPPEQLLSERDIAAAQTTFTILPPRWRLVATSQLRLFLRGHGAYASTLAAAFRAAPPGLRGRLWQIFYFAEASVLWRECERRGIRHIHAHLANVGSDVAMLAAALGTAHDPDRPWSWSFTMHGPTEFLDQRHFRLAAKVKSAAFVVCISEFARSQLMALCSPSQWRRLHVIHMGIPVAEFTRNGAASPDGQEILYIGRLVPEKGQAVLLEALGLLGERGCRPRLRLAGEGALRPDLERMAEELGVAGQVDFLGAVGQDQLRDLYERAAVFCLPSFGEGVPVVLMEAMAMEVPVVTTRIAGIPELVEDGRSGFVVAPGHLEELADRLQRLLEDPELRRGMGAAGRAKVIAEFDAERSAEELFSLFKRRRPAGEKKN
jgi:glycosyltransferase involved in cell wall biosynthesis